MRFRRTGAALLLLLAAVVVFTLTSAPNDAGVVALWLLAAAGTAASAVALVVVLVRVGRAARTHAHGADRPSSWWRPVLMTAALGAIVGYVLAFLAAAAPVAPSGDGRAPAVYRPFALAGLVFLTVALLVGTLASAMGTLRAKDGTRTRAGAVLVRMGLAGAVPGLLMAASGWFMALLLPFLFVGTVFGYPLLAAYWTDRLRAQGPGGTLERIVYGGAALALVALWVGLAMISP